MAKFQFRSKSLSLDFDGVEFYPEVNEQFTNALQECGKKMQDISESKTTTNNDCCRIIMDGIDSILGENAADKISKGRELDVIDWCDAINYISEELTEYSNAQSARLAAFGK